MTERLIGSPEIREIAKKFFPLIPHNADLGLELIQLDAAKVQIRMPVAADLVGDLENNLFHTSCQLSLMDAACGMAVFCALPEMQRVATLDLRVDYLRAAPADAALICDAECYHLTEQVAFVRATVWQNESRPIAKAVATFMRTSLKPRDMAVSA